MVIKVCGIKSIENIELTSKLKVDMIGLNFYPPSVRYINPESSAERFSILTESISRVGVFVNETLEVIDTIAKKYDLDYIQLHGDESVIFCKSVAKNHKIIKVFRIDEATDFNQIDKFSFVDYYLFDTATPHFGGSGKKFDWSMLDRYKGEVPFILSGGIGPDDAEMIESIAHPMFVGIDINSKFESQPGIKDSILLTPFVKKLRPNL